MLTIRRWFVVRWWLLSLLAVALWARANEAPASTNAVSWLNQPLSLADCLNLALDQNASVRKSRQDLEAAHGVVVQTRAIAIPKIQMRGNYTIVQPSSIETLQVPSIPALAGFTGIEPGNQSWSGDVRLVQSLYEGGRLRSALRTAKLTRDQALAEHQVILADTSLAVRTAYYDVLLAAQQIIVSEASVELLGRVLEDTQRRFDAGTVPQFNVLQAKVELANAQPRLIRARNSHRIAKNNLANLLGYHLPLAVLEDIPLRLSGQLEVPKYELALPTAIAQALEKRPELTALRLAERLQQEAVANAKAGYLPSLQAFGGYGSRNSAFTSDLSRDLSGWEAGVQVLWSPFDGGLTRGKVRQARALRTKAQIQTDDSARQIELEVRTVYSSLVEAWELLESQKQVQAEAEEALRLARARYEAGTGTQLDVLSARTALTEASTTQVQAQHDYAVARARVERATAADLPEAAAAR